MHLISIETLLLLLLLLLVKYQAILLKGMGLVFSSAFILSSSSHVQCCGKAPQYSRAH